MTAARTLVMTVNTAEAISEDRQSADGHCVPPPGGKSASIRSTTSLAFAWAS